MKKGDSIGTFLKAARDQLGTHFRELRGVSVDNLMYIKVWASAGASACSFTGLQHRGAAEGGMRWVRCRCGLLGSPLRCARAHRRVLVALLHAAFRTVPSLSCSHCTFPPSLAPARSPPHFLCTSTPWPPATQEDIILPQHYTFYELIKTQARGKSGPLFDFSVREDVRVVNDASKEKTDSHAGKIVERHWYDRNKHIFPANRWEVRGAGCRGGGSVRAGLHAKCSTALAHCQNTNCAAFVWLPEMRCDMSGPAAIYLGSSYT